MKYPLLLVLLLWSVHLLGQRDSSQLLTPQQLQDTDIMARNLDLRRTLAISATRSLEDIDELPWSVWVITADEILRYGFVTLGDVLRAAPGIKVSPSGTALSGETFLMRGLSGNEYVKLLINDVPVKPSVAAGISIGAQLPVRQAQRIEVLYGPAAALYGNEACVGVINIILKESERPVFTQADIALGNDGYNSLDLLCGGKLGKDRKIFRFSVYGSSTVRERTDLYYDQSLFDLNNYLPLGLGPDLYRRNRNFIPADSSSSSPKTVPAPHESRLFGIDLTWRGLHFSYHRMGRSDYSPLGLSPLALSWSNPSDRLIERTESFMLSYQRHRRRWVTNTNFSFLNYQVSNISTSTYIFDQLSATNFQFEREQPNAGPDSVLLQHSFDKLALNSRHMVARGFDARFESRIQTTFGRHFHLDAGIQIGVLTGLAPVGHLEIPVEVNLFGEVKPSDVRPFLPPTDGDANATAFGQLSWRTAKMALSVGTANDLSTNYGSFHLGNPRVAAFYRLDTSWSVFANYTTGFRRPSLYQTLQYYLFYVSNNNTGETAIAAGAYNPTPLQTETVQSLEGGLRYRIEGNRATLTFFQQEGRNLIRNGFIQTDPQVFGGSSWYYGYRNTPGLGLSMWGLQGLFSTETSSITQGLLLNERQLIGRLEFFIQYARGKEWYGEARTPSSDVFNAPHWQTQMRSFLTFGQVQLMLASNRQSSTLSKSVMYRAAYQRNTLERYHKYRTWDMRLQWSLSNHFLIYFQMQNMFDRPYAGLDATGTPDDLLYNPQPGRAVRFGVNYHMN